MKSKLVLWAASCLLSAVCLGQWLEHAVVLPDSLGAMRSPGAFCVNTGSNTVFIGGSDSVAVLDGVTNHKIAVIPLPGGAERMCYNPLLNKVYSVNTARAYVIDAAANALADSVALGLPAVDLCYAPTTNEMYCVDEGGTVVAIDCEADTVAGIVHVWGDPVQLCAAPAENKVYCGMYSTDRSAVAVIDCSTHTVVDSVYAIDIHISDMVYNPTANKLYVAWGGFGSVIIVDCANDSVLAWASVGEGEGRLAVNVAANKVYVSGDYAERVDVISGTTNNVVASIDSVRVVALVCDATDGVVFGVDPSVHGLVAIDCSADTLLGFTSVPGHPDSLGWNPVQNRVYVAVDDDVAVIDPSTRQVMDRIPFWFDIGQTCWNPDANVLYAGGRNLVAVVQLPENHVCRFVAVPATPRGFFYHSTGNKLYCATGSGLAVLDAAGDSLALVVPGTGSSAMVCYNPATDRLYVACADVIQVVDCAGDSVVSTISPDTYGVDTMVYSPASNRLFCALASGGVAVVDGSNDSIIEYLSVPADYHSLCYLAEDDMLACSNADYHSVFLFDCASATLLATAQLYYDPYALAYSDRSRKLYSIENAGRHVTVIDVPSMQPRTELWLTGDATATVYDSLADRLAFGLSQAVDEVRFIDCAHDSFVGSVSTPGLPVSMVAGAGRRLYVANQGASSFSVIRDTTTVEVGESRKPQAASFKPMATVVRGVLLYEARGERREARGELLDIGGRKVLDLRPGANDVSGLSPGAYFVREAQAQAQAQAQAVRKVVITR
jgi:DNA-binding beta-propeller fold protein YncE